ncbi:hypothetical protein LTR86_002155 [Recurvomyces mirabilis]|nr:hypothetical protein LTR86_002155 [Recurvomyces mirabilis]
MVFWKSALPAQQPHTAASTGMDHSEEMMAEVDEPPDERRSSISWASTKSPEPYLKTTTRQQMSQRRESLLTRQLHSETEHSDEEHALPTMRALSTQSTWSNQSASTAELTSDDGRTVSPPLAPTQFYTTLPIHEKPLERKVKIAGQDDAGVTGQETSAGAEKTVEATLGRKRCIMFACRGKDEAKPKTTPPTSAPAPAAAASVVELPASSPPKRKCMIKFACPSKSTSATKPLEPAPAKRHLSPPPPPQRRTSGQKSHRGSDSTVTHASPKSIMKSPSIITTVPTPTTAEPVDPTEIEDAAPPSIPRKLSNDSDGAGAGEALRFHEFASSEGESEEWMHESSCHRSRLTIGDTLQKESVIRKACEEVEEEVLEEDEDDDEAETAEEQAADLKEDEDDADEIVEEESDESDAGFHSDDEEGFAASDDDGEESDYEWWKPGGSTAATSVEHLDRLHAHTKVDADVLGSSLNSISSHEMSPKDKKRLHRRSHGHARSHAIPISNRLQVEDDQELPDSTDFVCGTLDEDRPMEQAYINRKKNLEAAKHKARPQDIDPTFPTSDLEMDEEDDDDLVDGSESDRENMVHGDMEEVDEEEDEQLTLKRRPSKRRGRSNVHHSPPPPSKFHSPPPSKRPSVKHHSPPPPTTKRVSARSPAPTRKLFGHSPRRNRSPAPGTRMTSPPNSRRASPSGAMAFMRSSKALAERPQLTHTASLPRSGFLLSRMGSTIHDDADGSDTVGVANDVPRRGAIDIVKGLEKKRQRRKEKMWQKMCAKAAAKGEKPHKVKPGKGCERMREVGLQLQEYQGKAQHILSL